MEIIQLIIILFALFALSRAILRFKDRKISISELIFWGIIWGAVIVLAIIPGVIMSLSQFLGIGRPVDLVVYLSIILLFYLIFRLYVKTESVEQEITRIVREISLKGGKKKK